MAGWFYSNPVKTYFGEGRFDELPRLVAGRPYCIVTYGEPYFLSLVERLSEASQPAVAVVSDVAPNPDFSLLSKQTARFAGLTPYPQVFVALGGGSVIDTAKVLAAAGGDFDRVKTFLETKTGEERLADTPIIAVPTTAGTGSEVTSWGTVWDSGAQKKYSLSRPSLYPEYAVVDPLLMLGKPRELTVSTGLDALSHALESLWNVGANPVSSAFATAAAREILEVLPRLAEDLGSRDLRGRMAHAAIMSGYAFSNTRTAIAHSLSYPITLRHNVAHGIACSFSLPIVLRSVAEDEGPCVAALRSIFGQDLTAASQRLKEFLNTLGVSMHPEDHGVSRDEWETLVEAAFDGERGLNFIGTKEKLHQAAKSFGVA
ncbi:MAG: iron-containing alcohol dehydrogenase PsrA [Rhodovibrionaceae bacterium]